MRAIRELAREVTAGRCWYCGEDGDSLEHQTAASRGGETTAANCVLACRTCNSRKRSRTVEEFRAYLLVVHGRAPRPFYGEAPGPDRDWLIVCDTPIVLEHRRDLLASRMATYGARQ